MKFRILSLITLTFTVCSVSATTIYVATNGSDEYPGTKEKPFASPYKARDHVRSLIRSGLNEDVTVYFRQGEYRLSKTLTFGLRDTPPNGHQITYTSYPNEQATLTSAIDITGWNRLADYPAELPKEARGYVWTAPLPEKVVTFLTLYDSKGMLPRAQCKGFVVDTPRIEKMSRENEDWYESLTMIKYPEGAMRDWENLEDVEVIIRPYFRWVMNILPLSWVNEESRTARTYLPATYPIQPLQDMESDDHMWVENVLEGLDCAGEWVINTRQRKVYLWARNSHKPQDIVAPTLNELIRVEGQIDFDGPVDIPAGGLAFERLVLTQAERGLWSRDDAGIQHDWDMLDKNNALLRFRGAENCIVKACTFTQSGDNGIRMDLYCQKIKVLDNVFSELGGGGILAIGYGPGTKDVNKHNEIVNNHIHHNGKLVWHAPGIILWQSGYNRIAHNYIHDMPRQGIILSGVRLYSFQPMDRPWRECRKTIRWHETGGKRKVWTWREIIPFLHSKENIVEYNELTRVLQRLGDGAAINASGTGDGNIIRRNYAHDIFSPESVSACFRTDNYQRNTLLSENVACHAGMAGFVLSGGAPGEPGPIDVINNIAVDVTKDKAINGCLRLWNQRGPVDGSIFEKNIFYQPIENATFYRLAAVEMDYARNCRFANNILYDKGVESGGKSENLAAFQAAGLAKTDLYVDPLFVDWKNGDFRLRPESPAHKLGIKSIDVRQAGLLKKN